MRTALNAPEPAIIAALKLCVCDSTPDQEASIAILPWLVLMRESASSRLRIGKGYYKWIFEQQDDVNTQVAAMHIHIERMDAIEDAEGRLLTIAQSVLPYPWLFPAVLRSEFELLAEAGPAFAFLDAFKMPFDPAV